MKSNNRGEIAAAVRYAEEGWKILDSGWPDFLMYRRSGGRIEVKFSEVKSETAPVRENQALALRVLSVLAPTVVCRERPDGSFREKRIKPPAQDTYYHRTDNTEWLPCSQHEMCSVQYHVCEPAEREHQNGC